MKITKRALKMFGKGLAIRGREKALSEKVAARVFGNNFHCLIASSFCGVKEGCAKSANIFGLERF